LRRFSSAKKLCGSIYLPAGHVSIARLKIDPVWDPIRNDPGFQELLAGKELVGPTSGTKSTPLESAATYDRIRDRDLVNTAPLQLGGEIAQVHGFISASF